MQADYSPLDSGLSTGVITLSGQDLQHLRTAGKWARFFAIVSLVFIALGVLFMLFFGGTMLAFMDPSVTGAIGGTMMLVTYGLVFALYIYPLVKLYQFGSKAVQAVDSNNQILASESIDALKSGFKFIGIFTAVVLGIYALIFVIGIIGGVASAF